MEKISLIIALVIAGLVTFLLEILTPTFGMLALVGMAASVGAVWLAFTISSIFGWALIILLVVGVPMYLSLMIKLLPRSPVGKRLFLGKVGPAKAEATPELHENESLVGQIGVAESILRPAGAVRVSGKRVIGIAESGIIQKDAKVKVLRTKGPDVVVQLVQEDS